MVKRLLILIISIFPYIIKAQTTGPTQPEVTSFPSISGGGMVDLYTGNLNYNIPLLTIPGSDGDYPIILGYTASPSVNNVPTWVGYNWNINTGAIVRNKRGIPDDFKGDTLQKKVYQKDKWNIGIPIKEGNFPIEVFGADLSLGSKISMYYDNYAGFGVKAGGSISPLNEAEKGKENMMSKGAWSLGVNFDSKDGVTLSPSLSLDHLLDKKEKKYSVENENNKNGGFGYYGTFRYPYSGKYRNKRTKIDSKTEVITNRYNLNYGLSFSKYAPLNAISIPRSTISTDLDITTDISLPFLKNKALKLKGNFSITKISEPYQEIPLYGNLYSQNGQANNNALMDSYRDNESPVTKESPFMAVTVNSFDVFSINAVGLGGSFRLYRNEVGQFKPKYIETKATNVEIGADFGTGADSFDVGADLNFASSKSYSGKWKNPNRINSLNSYHFNDKSTSTPLYEPAYFKLIGESYPLPLSEYKDIDYDNPIAFDIGNWAKTIEKPLSFKAKAFSTYNNGRNNISVNNKNARNPRTTSIEYKTKDEVNNGVVREEGLYKNKHILKLDGNGDVVSFNPISYDKGKGHHINQITVRKPNGSVYNFALPAYNTNEKKVVFATKEKDLDKDKMVPFTIGHDDNIKNGNGEDEYFSEEITPEYVHTYFLTSIQSLDYIDVKNDGYTDDDLGSWTKFIYTEVDNYHWRFPFNSNEASFIDGYVGNDEDNKATYTEGIKDLFYVSIIETKTHIAVFDIDKSALVDANNSNSQKYLKKVSLYSKSDPEYEPEFYLNPNHKLTPIKEVHFNYDYSLKSVSDNSPSTIPNFNASDASSDNILSAVGSQGQKGTLTLKELYFTYKKNQTGKDSRYKFEYNTKYNDTIREFPTDYSEDRWGNYQLKVGNYDSYENPYTYQKDSKELRDEKAGLWCLNKITLPSNGTIEIDYEKDDYQFVQDKKAMEYVKIIGLGYSQTGSYVDLSSSKVNLKNSNGYADRIYLEVADTIELKDRLRELKYIGFKAFMYLNTTKKDIISGSKPYEDYVSGYLENKDFIVNEDSNGVYLQINEIKPTNTAQYSLHPFQIATIQYIRNYRPDLQTTFDLETDPIQFARKNLNELIKAVKPLFTGYIKDKASKGWGKDIHNEKPSFLRLNTYKKKYGGDNRVSQVKLFPDPSNSDIYYGKSYQYILKDGTSSGVAEMEPIIGHEENGIVQPKFYEDPTGNKLLWLIQSETESAFVETPFGTSFLPAASVGYSRVIERSLLPKDSLENVEKSMDGITVSEFYTAKDFPFKPTITENPFRPIIKPVNITIPFIGSLSINNAGFTQGASFTINNGAYGKQKRIAVYPFSKDEPLGEPISEVEYIYKTNTDKTLNNKVKFLKKEGEVVEAYLGKEYDFYLEQYESGTTTIGGGVRPDIKFSPLVIPWPSIWPTFQYMESTSSYISSTKVIYNSPILEKTIQYKDGSKVISSPEYYDYETGTPIINSVTNEFGNKIFSYSFPAHWSYPRMKGAYKNYNAQLNIIYNSATGKCKLNPNQSIANIISEGDEVVVTGQSNLTLNKRYYVTNIDMVTNEFELKDRQNNNPNLPAFMAFIDRSGYRNLQSVNKGSIVSLKDYSSIDLLNLYSNQNISYQEKLKYFMNSYNEFQPNFISSIINQGNPVKIGTVELNGCDLQSVDIISGSDPYGIYFNFWQNEKGEPNKCAFIPLEDENRLIEDFSKLIFLPNTLNANSVDMMYVDPTNPILHKKIFKFRFNNNENALCFSCYKRIKTPVLQANAIEFSEDFIPNLNTLPSEETDISGQNLTDIYLTNSANPYAFGVKGIPRSKRTWAYIESRKQEGVLGEGLRNDLDGEFDYYPFNWNESPNYNETYNWRWVNEITQYNANGNSEEGKNRLEMFSANLFGFKNLLVTASAQNAEHNDIAFDGFEDYDTTPLQAGTISSSPTYRDLNHGNLNFGLKTTSLIGGISHTGNSALILEAPLTIDVSDPKYFKPTQKKYIISAWVYMGDITLFNSTTSLNKGGKIEVWEGTSLIASISPNRDKNNIIDGWIKIEGEFEPSTSNSNIKIKFIPLQTSNGNMASVFDDIRIQPFNSTIQTYVYDPSDYTLRYILNNQNYFSEFIRDSEGNLIQKNIETEEGKKTLSVNRNNISNN